jgi:hypothetical protein
MITKAKILVGKVIIVKAGTSESNDVRTAYGLNETKSNSLLIMEQRINNRAEDAMWEILSIVFNETA